jgi:hypothetical protein
VQAAPGVAQPTGARHDPGKATALIELAEQQRQELSKPAPVVIDPQTRKEHVLVRREVYAHARLHDLAGAVEGQPSLSPAGRPEEAASVKATGTTDGSGRPVLQHVHAADSGRDFLRVPETTEGERKDKSDGLNPLPMKGVATDCDQLRGVERRVSEGIRTPDIQSHSLAL